jgi:hypothetical protein
MMIVLGPQKRLKVSEVLEESQAGHHPIFPRPPATFTNTGALDFQIIGPVIPSGTVLIERHFGLTLKAWEFNVKRIVSIIDYLEWLVVAISGLVSFWIAIKVYDNLDHKRRMSSMWGKPK